MKWPNLVVWCVVGSVFFPFGALPIQANTTGPDPLTAKPGQTPDLKLEELAPRPRPPEAKAKETEADSRSLRKAAQTKGPLLPPLPDGPCKMEALTLCDDVGGHALHVCLGQHVAELSKLCRGTLRPYVVALLRTSCAADAKLLCSGIGKREVIDCLLDEEASTSMPCRAALEVWPPSLRPTHLKTKSVAADAASNKAAR